MIAIATNVSATAATRSPRKTRERPSYLRPVPAASERSALAAELDRMGTTVSYAAEKTIVEEGDPTGYVYKVTGGMLRSVRLLPDGRRCITSFLLAGDFFGFGEDGLASASVEALSAVTLVRYPVAAFTEFLDRNPVAARHFFHMVCKELSAAQDRLLLVGRKTALERLATFLASLTDRQPPKPAAKGVIVNLPMSRGDIADYLGLTVETVSRLLAVLRTRNIIEVPSATEIVVLDRRALVATGETEI